MPTRVNLVTARSPADFKAGSDILAQLELPSNYIEIGADAECLAVFYEGNPPDMLEIIELVLNHPKAFKNEQQALDYAISVINPQYVNESLIRQIIKKCIRDTPNFLKGEVDEN